MGVSLSPYLELPVYGSHPVIRLVDPVENPLKGSCPLILDSLHAIHALPEDRNGGAELVRFPVHLIEQIGAQREVSAYHNDNETPDQVAVNIDKLPAVSVIHSFSNSFPLIRSDLLRDAFCSIRC